MRAAIFKTSPNLALRDRIISKVRRQIRRCDGVAKQAGRQISQARAQRRETGHGAEVGARHAGA